MSIEMNEANFVPLSPVSFLRRASRIYPHRVAVIGGARQMTYGELHGRCKRLASALRHLDIRAGDRVAVLAMNTPEMLEAHYGVPGAGAVLVSLNTRLDAAAIAFIVRHSGSRVLLFDADFDDLVRDVVSALEVVPRLVRIGGLAANMMGCHQVADYEVLLRTGSAEADLGLPADELEPIAINYTSGTTGNPKGVVLHHRGAYLNACANALAFQLDPRSVYLWTLPMFHCNGWTYTWAVTLVGATHVCLRKIQAEQIYEAIDRYGVTHMCAAPVVLSMLIHSAADLGRERSCTVSIATGGAAPPTSVIAGMEERGFAITHLYGMTETYGPSTICVWQPEVGDMDLSARAQFMARQGVPHPLLEEATVLDTQTLQVVPADGQTLGELVIRGNTVMQCYLDNPAATAEAFAGGWFHTGDLAVMHPDGYIEVKDRMKDIIISGGENISSLEVEEVLYQHPDVQDAAVVARPDPHWGETPQAFVQLRPGASADVNAQQLMIWCRSRLAHFKAPRFISIGELPKTVTGKIQKFALRQRARDEVSRSA